MKNYRLLLDPEDMTPDEQTQRIMDLFAGACVSLINEEKSRAKAENRADLAWLLPSKEGIELLLWTELNLDMNLKQKQKLSSAQFTPENLPMKTSIPVSRR